jgi:hypothetical protein
MKLFCQECFAKVEYKFSKPKFCPECGAKIGISSVKIEQKPTVKNSESDRIKELEAQLNELKNQRQEFPKNAKSSNRKTNYQNDEDYNYEDEDGEEYEENYFQIQKHINNFKNKRITNGVSVEKNNANTGISFGKLMEGVSSGAVPVEDEFKMLSEPVRKTDKEILEELRVEASSKARAIEIN